MADLEAAITHDRAPSGRGRCSAASGVGTPTATTSPPRQSQRGRRPSVERRSASRRPGARGRHPPAMARWRPRSRPPPASLAVVGVTGTNGKTTDPPARRRADAGGPADRRDRHAHWPRTTPEAPDLQARLAAFRDAGGGRGHGGLVPRPRHPPGRRHPFRGRRVHQPQPDHLDFHPDQDYFAAKARLFVPARAGRW